MEPSTWDPSTWKRDDNGDVIEVNVASLGLTSLPDSVLGLKTLQLLNASGNQLSALPSDMGERFPELRILFLSQNQFAGRWEAEWLRDMPKLRMLGLRDNALTSVPDDAFPESLEWLILTSNELKSVGRLPTGMRKLMLSNNELETMPEGYESLSRLELLRIANNSIPSALVEKVAAQLPELRWLGASENPSVVDVWANADVKNLLVSDEETKELLASLDAAPLLGQGSAGLVYRITFRGNDAVYKSYRSMSTSDGRVEGEVLSGAKVASSDSQSLQQLLGITKEPLGVICTLREGLLDLGGAPSFDSCTRDVYAPSTKFSETVARNILSNVAEAVNALHECGLCHGDVYAHNILYNPESGKAVLVDFGSAWPTADKECLALDWRAFKVLVDEIQAHTDSPLGIESWKDAILNEKKSAKPSFTLRFAGGKVMEWSEGQVAAMQVFWDERNESSLANCDQTTLDAFVAQPGDDDKLRLELLLHFAESWTDESQLRRLAAALIHVKLGKDEEEEVRLFCSLCAKLALKPSFAMFEALFGETTRTRLLNCMETGVGRRDASAAFTKLCLFCLEDKKVDAVVVNFIRYLIIPLRRILRDEKSDLQAVVNASQIIAARCASQSFDKMREPDEVVLFAEAGLFDDMGTFLNQTILLGPLMNAIAGLMVSPEALQVQSERSADGPLVKELKKIREKDRQASNIVDAIELVSFKRVVQEKSKQKGDDGKSMGNDLLGVIGAANGPQQFGFEFTNKTIEKDFKDLAFKEGVLKPMAEKMRENGEEPMNVDNIASSVLRDFTAPKQLCNLPGCSIEALKRCGGCKAVWYCTADHQKKDWASHKSDCKK